MKYPSVLAAIALAFSAEAGTATSQVGIQGNIANDVSMNVLGPIDFGTIPLSSSMSVEASTNVAFTSGVQATPSVCPDTPGSSAWNLNGGYSKNVASGGGTVRLSLALNNVPLPISCAPVQLRAGYQVLPLKATLVNESGYTGLINTSTTLYIAF